jgi:hypothetical protein
MRFKENNLIAEAYAKVLQEAKMKPSAGLTKKQKSNVAKKARAGKDIGKKGPGFAKMAKAAGGGEKGKKIAAAAMWKSVKRESTDIASIYGRRLLRESAEDLRSMLDGWGKVDIYGDDASSEYFGNFDFSGDKVSYYNSNFVERPEWKKGFDNIIANVNFEYEPFEDAMSKGLTIDTKDLGSLVNLLKKHLGSLLKDSRNPMILKSESVSSEQYDEIVSIIHSAIAKAKLSKPELSNEIEQVWDVVSDLWADHEMRVYNALMIDQIPEEDQMIPKVEKILQKMTEDLGSEDLAVEALSKWDEDEMNEYYNNHLMGEEDGGMNEASNQGRIKNQFMKSWKDYIADSEDQEGAEYWNMFNSLEELVADFLLYVQNNV